MGEICTYDNKFFDFFADSNFENPFLLRIIEHL